MLQRFELLVAHARPAIAWGGCSIDFGNTDIFSCSSASDGCCAALQSNVEHWVPSSSDHDDMDGLKYANVSLIHISHYLHRPLLAWIRDHSSLVAIGGSVVGTRTRTVDQPIHPRVTNSVVCTVSVAIQLMCTCHGCLQVVHTFMRGCELIGRPTKPKFLLEAGELRGLFEGPAKQRWDPLRSRWLNAALKTATLAVEDTHRGDSFPHGKENVESQGAPEWEVVMDEVRPISDGRPLSFFMATRVG